MPLGQHRIPLQGDTPYPHEREAIAFVENELPNQAPFLVWELVELLDASTGRLYEIDLLVLGYSALYLVEIKSGAGVYKGDCVDWSREVDGEPPHYTPDRPSAVTMGVACTPFRVATNPRRPEARRSLLERFVLLDNLEPYGSHPWCRGHRNRLPTRVTATPFAAAEAPSGHRV